MRTVAFDGLHSLKVPDTDRNRAWLGRIHYRMGFAGYPTLQVMALVETGTRALLGAAVGGADDRDEPTLAAGLLTLLRPGMLVLLDRAFDSTAFLEQITKTGARVLVRGELTRKPWVLRHLSDGSYLSLSGGLKVRIIEADLVMIGADGSRVGERYRLITTLTDHHRHPASELTTLYHEDRASFTTALETARDQLTAARNIHSTDLLGLIGQAVLTTLLSPRRPRFSTRKVKNPTSRYLNRDDGRPPNSTTTINITIHTPTLTTTPPPPTRPPRTPHNRTTPPPATRRARVINLMNTDPHRPWNGTQLATQLNIPAHNLLTQLAEWTRLGLLTKTSKGHYTPNQPPTSTTPPTP